MTLDVFEYSSCGGRDHNEDMTGIKRINSGGIFIVADGLGGHRYGELASECAVTTMTADYNGLSDDPESQIKELFAQANTKILQLQKEKGVVMKSTATVLAIEGSKAVWANSGDSRVYFFHKNRIHAYTEDHSVAYKKYKAGEITKDMLSFDEDQSRLLRTLGSQDRFSPDVYIPDVSILPGDAFLLCSDGAWEYIKDEEMLIDLFKAENAQHWAELMLVRVMERINGNNDNLSLVTIMINT